MPSEHSAECLAAGQVYSEAEAAFAAQWPGYCRICGGQGGAASTYDPSPAGVCLGGGYLTDFDPCAACIQKGICPRCGTNRHPEFIEDGDMPCPACGWNWGNTPGDALTPSPECFCGLYEDSTDGD